MTLYQSRRLLLLQSCVAVAAVYGSVAGGLERNSRLFAAAGAGGGEEFSLGLAGVLLCIAACLASLRLVLEASLSIELLLTGGEHEILTAILAL